MRMMVRVMPVSPSSFLILDLDRDFMKTSIRRYLRSSQDGNRLNDILTVRDPWAVLLSKKAAVDLRVSVALLVSS
jgi:hypothetical protein